MRRLRFTIICASLLLLVSMAHGQQRPFKVLAFYSTHEEPDHVEFAREGVSFFKVLAKKDRFSLRVTTHWSDLNAATLRSYQVVLWLNASPSEKTEQEAFEQYMEHGGAWIGFHAAGYNDASTHWPWFARFMGAVFYDNSWPPLPATLIVSDPRSAATVDLPSKFVSPANEWYCWKPDPRASEGIKVLLTLDPANYPLGMKDTLLTGDVPVVWTNTRYQMIYINMGHGNQIFTSPVQNRLFENALLLLGRGSK